jgi:phosphomannomutase
MTKAAALINYALAAGLLSMGVDVYDIGIESVPLAKYCTKFFNADMEFTSR